MPKSLPMLDPNDAPAPGDLIYTVKDTGLPDRDQRSTLMGLLQAYLSGAFEDLGTLTWDEGQPITSVPAWRPRYPSGDLEQGWLNLRDVLDPVSNVDLSWNITSESPVVALESYTQSIRVAVSGNSASARSFTITGTPRAGQEIWFFIGTANLVTPATIKHGSDTLATVRGGELVRVYTLGVDLVAQVVGGPQNLGRSSDLTWLTGPILESWFAGLGWTDAGSPGWTGDQLLTVLNAFGPTYQEAASAAAAARKLSEEVSAPFGAEACAWVDGVTLVNSDDVLIPGIPCRAVQVRGHVVDVATPTTSASISLSMALSTLITGSSPVEVALLSGANAAMDAFVLALVSATEAPVPVQLYAKCILRDGSGNIRDVFARLLISGTLTPVVQIWFYTPAYTHAITWDELGTMFPGGGVVLQLHETFTIPAPTA